MGAITYRFCEGAFCIAHDDEVGLEGHLWVIGFRIFKPLRVPLGFRALRV